MCIGLKYIIIWFFILVDWEENYDVDLRLNNYIEFIFKIELIGILI